MPLLFWLLLVLAFGLWARRTGHRVAVWAAGAGWMSWPLYEIWLRRVCSGDCGIRVDLLIILPLLLGLTGVAAYAAWRARGRPDR